MTEAQAAIAAENAGLSEITELINEDPIFTWVFDPINVVTNEDKETALTEEDEDYIDEVDEEVEEIETLTMP